MPPKSKNVKSITTIPPKRKPKVQVPDGIDVSYLAALTHPFSRHAVGAKIPSLFPLRTTTSVIRLRTIARTNANGTFEGLLSPNPLYGLGPATGVPGNFTLTGDTVIVDNPNHVQTNHGATTYRDLAALGKFRVVGFGAKVSSYVSDTDNGGLLSYGSFRSTPVLGRKYISPKQDNKYQVIAQPRDTRWDPQDTLSALYGIYSERGELVHDQAADTAILDYWVDTNQIAQNRVSVQSLRSKDLVVAGKPAGTDNDFCDPLSMRQTGMMEAWEQGNSEGDNSVISTLAFPTSTAYERTYSDMDMTTHALFVHGASANTDVMAVDIIYHIEHFDSYAKSSVGMASATAAPRAHRVLGSKEKTHAVASTQPSHFLEEAGEVASIGAAAYMAPTAAASMMEVASASAYSWGGGILSTMASFLPEIEAALPYMLLM